jgi:hypothetical protein
LLAIETIATTAGVALLLVTSANVMTYITIGPLNNAIHTTGVASLKQGTSVSLKLRIITAIISVFVQPMGRLASASILSIEVLRTSVRSIAKLVTAPLQARPQLLYRVKFAFRERILTAQIMDIV